MLELHSRNNLGKHINGILFGECLLWLDIIFIKNLLNKVKSYVNMLCPCMINLVIYQIDITHAITIDFQWILINLQVVKRPLNSNCLFHSLHHDHIFSLRSRQNDS